MDFKAIEPLIEKESFRNNVLEVTFTCEETRVSHQARVNVEQSVKDKLVDSAKSSVKKQLLRSARRSLASLIRSSLGGGVAGSIARELTGSALSQAGSTSSGSKLSESQREEVIVEAFKQVTSHYVYNTQMNKWVGVKKEQILPFYTLLEECPVADRYDQSIVARMLVEVAASDGDISGDEKEFLAGFLPEGVGTVDEILQKGALKEVELKEASKGKVRETMLLLAWGLAFADDELGADEKEKIKGFAAGLELDDEKQQEIKDMAAQYVIDQLLTQIMEQGDFESGKKEVYALAGKLDVSEELVQRTEINFKKRHFLF